MTRKNFKYSKKRKSRKNKRIRKSLKGGGPTEIEIDFSALNSNFHIGIIDEKPILAAGGGYILQIIRKPHPDIKGTVKIGSKMIDFTFGYQQLITGEQATPEDDSYFFLGKSEGLDNFNKKRHKIDFNPEQISSPSNIKKIISHIISKLETGNKYKVESFKIDGKEYVLGREGEFESVSEAKTKLQTDINDAKKRLSELETANEENIILNDYHLTKVT